MTQSKQPAAPVVLITGGSRGLGRSMALHLADRGTDVIITYRGEAAAAQQVLASLQQKGRKAAALPLEVRDARGFGAFAEAVQNQLQSTFGRERLYALVNNAGTGAHAPFAETSEEQLDELFAIHLKAPLSPPPDGARARLRARGPGPILTAGGAPARASVTPATSARSPGRTRRRAAPSPPSRTATAPRRSS